MRFRIWMHLVGCYFFLHTWRRWTEDGETFMRCLCCKRRKPVTVPGAR